LVIFKGEGIEEMFTKGITLSGIMVAVLCLAVISAGAQEKSKGSTQKKQGIPTGKVTIEATQVAAGLGYTWGDGTLKFKGKEYKFKVSGLNVVALGVTTIRAKGEVYNLNNLSDFPGKYFGVQAGATVIKGSAGLLLKNSAGVILNLKSQQTGAELRLGNEGLSISPAWQ
jgi:hypothetical protein